MKQYPKQYNKRNTKGSRFHKSKKGVDYYIIAEDFLSGEVLAGLLD